MLACMCVCERERSCECVCVCEEGVSVDLKRGEKGKSFCQYKQ